MSNANNKFMVAKKKSKAKKEINIFFDRVEVDLKKDELHSSNRQKKEKSDEEKVSVLLWMKTSCFGDKYLLLEGILKEYEYIPTGKIGTLWESVHIEMIRVFGKEYTFIDGYSLRSDINNRFNVKERADDKSLICLCYAYKIKLLIITLNKEFKPIKYGDTGSKRIHLLHIGYKHFMPVKEKVKNEKYILSDEDNEILKGDKSVFSQKDVEKDNKRKEEKNLIKRLTHIVQDKEHAQDYSYIPSQNSNRKPYYNVTDAKELEKNKNLKICKLHLKNAHVGTASIISKTSSEDSDISLLNRKNCGYNAFEGDTVYVEINDQKSRTGRVLGVQCSYHKPVNSIFLCKVCRDQGSHMSPIDGSIPKILVYNQPGRERYSQDLKAKKRFNFTDAQKSEDMKIRENSRYGDNVYVTIYKMTFKAGSNKPNFIDGYVERFDPETCDKLFLVFYEYWDVCMMYPSGRVVGMISTYDCFQDSLHLLMPLCNIEKVKVNDFYKEEIKTITNQVNEIKDLPVDVIPKGAMVFTIDNEETQDMDDALSYHVSGELIVVGVHISNITKYIHVDKEIFKQAKRRFATAYIPKELATEPIYVIEKDLSTHFFSLVPNEIRAVVSILFYFERLPPHRLKMVKFKETFIRSKYKLSYRQVEQWLKASERPMHVEEDLYISIKSCYNIAKELRCARLPDSFFVRQSNYRKLDFNFDDCFNAKILIEEFMILANETVAKKIYKRYPNMSLLRVQNPVTDYEEWQKKLFALSNTNCRSSLTHCCNLLNINRDVENIPRPLTVSVYYYNDLVGYLTSGDVTRARNMLQYDEYINDFYVHLTEWYGISSPARYDCSIKNCVDNRHFSLNMDFYTHFTSPIRRFTDVIVHLLLRSIINSSKILDSVITEHNIAEVCTIANKRLKGNGIFEKHCAPYAIFESSPTVYNFVLDCACSKFTNEELHFIHPSLRKTSSKTTIKFSYLSLNQSPVNIRDTSQPTSCDLKWKRIIYSSRAVHTHTPQSQFVIDNQLYDAVLPVSKNSLFETIRISSERDQELEDDIRTLSSAFLIKKDEINASEVISSDSLANPIIEIQLKLSIKNTIRVQFCCYKFNGLKRVTPQLFIVHPNLQLCLIHQEDPVICFIPGGKLVINNDIMWSFETIREYEDYFIPLIQIESLTGIMDEKSEHTFVDVKIQWMKAISELTRKEETFGILKYDQAVCDARHVEFGEEDEEIKTFFEDIIEESLSSVTGDLICIRGKMKEGYNYWVGHGAIVNVCQFQVEDTDQMIKVIIFMLTQSDFDIFQHGDMTFFVEMYQQSVATRRQMNAVKAITRDKFLKQIVFGRNIESIQTDPDFMEKARKSLINLSIPEPNHKQVNAIKNAFKEKLSLIWGPPGTGKTSIGCIIAYCYALKNGDDGVILYCGPSNESVNIILNAMTEKFKTECPKMLRIFSKKQELADFPLPGHFTNCNPLPEALKQYSLHFLLRDMDNVECIRLNELDNIFKGILDSSRRERTDIIEGRSVHQLIREYKMLLKKLKQEYIERNPFNMVLTTTCVGGSPIMANFVIRQIIIDEAGMCEEPETLVPIVKSVRTLHNVVLIGDHKQLRPVIMDDLASRRGLQISLFERYQVLRPKIVTMLDQQYRMHPSICEFPSHYFYKKTLKTKISPKWSGLQRNHFQEGHNYDTWNGVDYEFAKPIYLDFLNLSTYNAAPDCEWPGQREGPDVFKCFDCKFRESHAERIVFINIVGDEIVSPVSTNKCNENSRANIIEVNAVVKLYERLIFRMDRRVNAAEHITILTQYRLQESYLLEECKKKLISSGITSDPIIRTVIKSQGSENDYVIFSTVRSLRNKADIIDNPTPGWENKYLGFITDPNQVNVALTRARKGLIIIGNKQLLSVNVMWKQLLRNLEDRRCIMEWNVACDRFLNIF